MLETYSQAGHVADHSSSFSIEINYAWSYTSTPLYVVMECTTITLPQPRQRYTRQLGAKRKYILLGCNIEKHRV